MSDQEILQDLRNFARSKVGVASEDTPSDILLVQSSLANYVFKGFGTPSLAGLRAEGLYYVLVDAAKSARGEAIDLMDPLKGFERSKASRAAAIAELMGITENEDFAKAMEFYIDQSFGKKTLEEQEKIAKGKLRNSGTREARAGAWEHYTGSYMRETSKLMKEFQEVYLEDFLAFVKKSRDRQDVQIVLEKIARKGLPGASDQRGPSRGLVGSLATTILHSLPTWTKNPKSFNLLPVRWSTRLDLCDRWEQIRDDELPDEIPMDGTILTIAETYRQVDTPWSRRWVILGPGGAGKSFLAQKLAQQLLTEPHYDPDPMDGERKKVGYLCQVSQSRI